jgi:flagellin
MNNMALTVNTNIASLSAQRNLTSSQSDLSTSLERLSSGLRINSAKDDAAGLAISERFTAQIKGLNQGVRNANDGISLAQTGEGALREVSSNLQRIRELAVQSANATNTDSDRTALQAEVAQLVAEIDRVAQKTKFNGIALLDGSFTSKAFQVGSDANETVSITAISSARTAAIGGSYSATSTSDQGVGTTTIAADTVYLNGVAITAAVADGVSTASANASAKAKASAINATAGTGVTATASTTVGGSAGTAAAVTGTITINGQTTASFTTGGSSLSDDIDVAVSAINAISGATGVTAAKNGTTKLDLTAADGRNIVHAFTTMTAAATGMAAAATTTGTLSLTSTSSSGIKVAASATGNADATQSAKLGFSGAENTAATGSGVAMSVASVATVSGANETITAVDNAITTINSIRSSLGSYQSRFESVVANAQTAAENLSASRSRIMDADFAAETAQLTKSQILQQSGIAMLAQANSIPQNVLALLQ